MPAGGVLSPIPPTVVKSPDDIDWVRHVNGRWIVRESLRQDAAAWIDHLFAIDPARLQEVSRRARLLTTSQSGEDPKPWFYAGLFSLATREEASQFLKGHDFTIACIPPLADAMLGSLKVDEMRPDTAEKIRRVRAALEAMG
jgi:hypothetical protein